MKNALQAQLLKAGLVDNKKAKKINKQVAHAKRTGDDSVNQAKVSVAEAKAEKVAKDQQLNQQRQRVLEEKTLKANIIQMITQHQVKDVIASEEDLIEYKFVDGKKIKKLSLSKKIYDQVVAGHLLIARMSEEISENSQYALLPYPLAERIEAKKSGFIIQTTDKAEDVPVEDDPYAQYVIPDDLMW